MPEANRHGAERDNKRRKKKPRNRKPWELGSEGEETSDGSSTEKVLHQLTSNVFIKIQTGMDTNVRCNWNFKKLYISLICFSI